MRSNFRSRIAGVAVVVTGALALGSCASDLTRTGSSPSFLVIESLLGARGDEPDDFGSPLFADVQNRVQQSIGGQDVCVATVVNDLGQVRVRAALKNPLSPTGPTTINAITVERYRVVYRRADGRNTPGVDVPHPFDGAVTFTVPVDGTATFGFEVVRIQSKLEAPLRAMVGSGGAMFVNTLAEVTFYGRDQAGNEVSVTGTLAVNFGDFADEC